MRNKGIKTLGEIETAYLEREGSVSVFKFPAEKQKPDLPTISEDMIKELNPYKAGTKVESSGYYSCYKTGDTDWLEKGSSFPDCEGDVWIHQSTREYFYSHHFHFISCYFRFYFYTNIYKKKLSRFLLPLLFLLIGSTGYLFICLTE
ncbi:hypothetical protein FXV91_06920 [Methanosarcina sp. DH2]|uniref:hypothetical protein n=1 Tax=Methanosarcina sp. DH2 TaxID=2605639 RepID=UPI001E62418C|nr:hypothetical protein [Methanosarcina sp. DH2]MCC4769943.1 hypothetical protein [Methanosarcina sp. DH2]